MCSFLLLFLIFIAVFTLVHDFTQVNFQYLAEAGQTPPGYSSQEVVLAQNREDLSDIRIIDSGAEDFHQTSFQRFCLYQSDIVRNTSDNGCRRGLSMGLSMWTTQQKSRDRVCALLGALVKRIQTRCYSEESHILRGFAVERHMGRLGSVVRNMERAFGMERLGRVWQCWQDRFTVTKIEAVSARCLFTTVQDGEGKRQRQAERKRESQRRAGCKPIHLWQRSLFLLAAMAEMGDTRANSLPFQSAQSSKGSTMQEMATHLRSAYKEKETPAEVQAFLDKAEKEYSRNSIKSLHAATKSLDYAQKALRDAVTAKKEHRLQWTKHVGEGIKVWEAQLENYRVHQASLAEHAARARSEIEAARRILKEVSENSIKEGNLSIPQPIQEENEEAANENSVDPEEQKLRDQLQGVLNACAGSLGLQSAPQETLEVSDEEKELPPQHKRPRSVEPAKPAAGTAKQ